MQKIDFHQNGRLYEILSKFLERFGDELDACHPDANDSLIAIINNQVNRIDELKDLAFEFYIEYSEDLEGCNEEAFEFISEIVKKFDIE